MFEGSESRKRRRRMRERRKGGGGGGGGGRSGMLIKRGDLATAHIMPVA